MRLCTIINPTVQLFHMPRRQIGNGETFGGRLMLQPGSRIEVPEAYVEALKATCKTERGKPKLDSKGKPIPTGWALRLEKTGESTFKVKGPKGAMGVFEARILAAREATLKAQEEARLQSESAAEATERAILAEKRTNELEQRLAQLEVLLAEKAEKKAPSADPEKKGDAPPAEPKKDTPPKK